jgi:hypothetical protein
MPEFVFLPISNGGEVIVVRTGEETEKKVVIAKVEFTALEQLSSFSARLFFLARRCTRCSS